MSQQPEEEEKKKGAAPLPAGGAGSGAGSSFSLEQLESLQNSLGQLGMGAPAAGGAAGGGMAAALASKVGMIIVVGMLGVGAMNMRSNQLSLNAKPRAKAEKPHYEGDLSNLPTNPQQPDAIQGVVIGDMTRKGDEAAAEAAAAEAAARAQADADAEAAKKQADDQAAAAAKAAASMSPTPAMKAGDLTAKAAKLPLGKGGKGFDKKFGQLSTSLGSGSGGASSSASFKPNAVAQGQSKSMGASPKATGMRGLGAKGGGRGGRAFGQLQNINGLSRQGAKVGGEGGSSLADQGFSNGAGGGSAITGGGSGVGGAGVMISHPDSSPNGAPVGGQNGGGNADGTQAPPDAGHKNATPWQKYVDIATWAMVIAGIALLATYVLAQMAKKTIPVGSGLLLAAKIAAGIAIAAGAVCAAMGLIVMGMGQTMQGLMYTAGGAIVGVLAYKQLVSEMDLSKEASETLISGPDPETSTGVMNDIGTTSHLGDEGVMMYA